MDDKKEWDELACKAQQGDKKAYSRLLKSIAPYIKHVISPDLSNKDWADDIVQDVLMGVHKSLARYMINQPFRPWLNAIIRYRRAEFFSRYYHRQEHMNVSFEDDNASHDRFEDPIASLGHLQDIETALAQLPSQQQEIVRLLRIEGHSVKEVALKIGLSESAIKVSAHRGTQKIKIFLQAKED